MSDKATQTPVLIVGGSPVGLALAADLGRRGIQAPLIEKRDDKIGSPKMLEVSVRTMEFCRQLGISEQGAKLGISPRSPDRQRIRHDHERLRARPREDTGARRSLPHTLQPRARRALSTDLVRSHLTETLPILSPHQTAIP